MSICHILPGYGEPVTRLRRVRSAGCYPLDSSILKELEKSTRLSQQEFSRIRENAKDLWSKQLPRATTYDTFFSNGEIKERIRARPTSSHRRNNPHPTQLFMTNRLHFIAGYHKPETTVGRSAYKIDASLNPADQKQRQAFRDKFAARTDSAMINQYRDHYGFRNVLPPREAQAAEAWVKLADDVDHDRVLEVLKEQTEWRKLHHNEGEQLTRSAYPSLQRWMRKCGAEEHGNISRIMQTPISLGKYESYENEPQFMDNNMNHEKVWARKFPQLRRGEYSIHPDWPVSIPHHRIP